MAELNSMRRSALDGFHGGSSAARLTAAPNAARGTANGGLRASSG